MIHLPVYCITCTKPQEVVDFLARDKAFISNVRNKIKKNFVEDLLQDLFIIFLTELPQDKVMQLNADGTIIIFAYGILKKTFDMSNNRKQSIRLYRSMDGGESKAKKMMDIEYQTDQANAEREVECNQAKQIEVSKAITKLDLTDKYFWSQWKTYTMYMDGNETFEELSKRVGIDVYSLKYAVGKARNKVKNEIKNGIA